MDILDRFLAYTRVYTTSDPDSTTVPTAARELDLANILCGQMKEIGIADAHISEYGYVYGTIPATPGYEKAPALGLIAHMDTAPDCSGENVNPQVIPNYDGGDVKLGTSGRELNVEKFPHLPSLKGRTLITTDGTTLLGADDKAGVAEIMDACERIIKENIPHGKLCVAFTPDEEVGQGADHFDVKGFGADYAYTFDGGPENEFSFENFNAAAATVAVKGFEIHPGDAKNTMINASLVLMEFNNMLPSGDTPRDTEWDQGFFHLYEMAGELSNATAKYLIREHNKELFAGRKKTMEHAAELLNDKYGAGTVTVTIKDQYPNMREIIDRYPFLVEFADKAIREAGGEPMHLPTRGGTDGASLSYEGLPCPNFGTGGYAYHGYYEHITLEGLRFVSNVAVNLVKLFADKQ